jgi:uncharacterized membrane protein YhaH (DUF805 family)
MNWYLSALKKYVVFTGRARRKEYWFFQLFNTLFLIALIVIDNVTGMTRAHAGIGHGGLGLLSGLYGLATFLPALGVMIRRLHDTGRSGWWILIGFIPFIGGIILLIFMLLDSQPGTNQYGPNPKAEFSGSMAGGAAVQAR